MKKIKKQKNTLSNNIDDFANDCLNDAKTYEKQALNGEIIVSEWIKKAIIREQKLRKKYFVNEEKVKDVYKFFYFLYINKNERFKPLPFQCWIIYIIYLLYKDKACDLMLRKHVVIWMSRKNGKTFFSTALSLYNLINEEFAQVYFLATTNKQASIALKFQKQIVTLSPQLKKRIRIYAYHLQYKYSTSEAVPNVPEKLDGLNPSFAIIDESHAHKTRELFNIINTGTKQRKNSLIIEISTAGFNKAYPFFQVLETGKKVLEGEEEIDNTLYIYYTLDSEEEIDNPKMWIKSNPALNVLINEKDLIEDYNKAKTSTSELNSFIVKNLNYYRSENIENWINDNDIKEISKDFDINELRGCKAYAGLDLASTRDLASLVLVVEKDGLLYVVNESYLPSDSDKIVRLNGLDISSWIKDGYIIQTENRTIDYEYILQRVIYYSEFFDLQAVGYDKWNSSQIVPQIQYAGIYCEQCPQNTAFFNYPLKGLEKLILEKKIVFPKNPVLRWQFSNIVIYQDGNDNIKIMKNKSKDSVDSPVAMGMALGMYYKQTLYDYTT